MSGAPHLELGKLRRVKPWEYALRFGFGGAITVIAALVAKQWGAAAGGLLLAFPAIMPASLTLVKQHDGRASAAADARGGRVGNLALACFAAVVAIAVAAAWPVALALVLASVVWGLVAVGAWFATESRSAER
jgi:hypothetical protein